MSTGLLALLDDIVAISKVAAASLDDAAGQAVKVGAKTSGIVIDDAAVTPRYVVGFAASRELPIIRKIAIGSLKNKIIILLPGALALSFLAPWALPPILMLGGAYLCLEGFHKVIELIRPHQNSVTPVAQGAGTQTASLEDSKVASAIRTDLILSAEIMAISVAMVATSPLWMQTIVLAIVGIGMTAVVYGAVAIIVKADDVGLAMANTESRTMRVAGRTIVKAMPGFLQGLSLIGMIAMLWVGGGIIVHSVAQLGLHAPEDIINNVAARAGSLAPAVNGLLEWFVGAAILSVVGIGIGVVAAPITKSFIAPLFTQIGDVFRRLQKKPA